MSIKFKSSLLRTGTWAPPRDRKGLLQLDLNENYDLIDNKLLELFKNFDNRILTSYPEYDEILELLAAYTEQPKHCIALTNGANQAIDIIIRMFWQKGDQIIMPSPIFSIYDHLFAIEQMKINHTPYELKKDTFTFPFNDTFSSILPRTKGVILCNPNNPLGSEINREEILRILKKTKRLNIPCIIDEAYYEFCGETSQDLLKQYDNLIIIRSFSKIFGLAGVRFGYILANKYMIEQILKLRAPWDVNHFAVFAATIVLNHRPYFNEKLKEFFKRKELLTDFLRQKNFQIFESRTNFIVLKHDKSAELIKFLRENQILVNNLSHYPFSYGLLQNAIRITIPASDADMLKLQNALSKFT